MIYLKLFIVFLKIGLFSFGGGYGTIPLMKQEVITNGWLSESQFLDIVGISESTPGPIAVNLATFVGTHMGGLLGAIIATISVILPAFLIMFVVYKVLEKFSSNKYISAFLKGVTPVVVGLILAVGITLILKAIKVVNGGVFSFKTIDIRGVIITVLVALIILLPRLFKKKTPPIISILCSALLGIVVYLI